MARAKASPRQPQRREPPPEVRQQHPAQEFTGLVLLALGLVLFLSLISYTPQDLPSWFPLRNGATPQSAPHTLNFLGKFGAMVAVMAYTFLGSAAYLMCAMLLGYGSAKLILPDAPLSRRALWSISFVLSGACLAQLLNVPLIDARKLGIAGEGGWVGKHFGESVLREVLGFVGAVSALGLVYLASILYMTGIAPAEVLAPLLTIPPRLREQFVSWLEARAEARALRQAEMEMSADRLASTVLEEPSKAPPNERRKSRPIQLLKDVSHEPHESKSAPAARVEASADTALLLKANRPLSETESGETPYAEDPPVVSPTTAEPVRPAPQIIDGTAPPPPRPKEPKKDKEMNLLSPVDCEGYELPPIDLLDAVDLASREAVDPTELRALQDVVIETLAQFGIEVSAGDITRGPTITRYEVYPAKGVRVDRILALERDLARATCAERINILAPIPGKDTVGIEIANSKKQKVTLRELFESDDFSNTKARIPIALGKDVYGKTIVADLAAMPHGLVAGTTGSGKSVCINAIIASILYRFTPDQLRFIMIDPKVVEMQMYNSLPHLVVPVVTDPKKVLLALRWAVDEMEKRYTIFAKTGVRNIAGFNARPKPKTQKELDEARLKLQPDLFDEPPVRSAPEVASAAEPIATELPAALLDPEAPLESPVELPPDADPAVSAAVADNEAPRVHLTEEPGADAVEAQTGRHPEEADADADSETPVESLSAEERITKMTTIKVPRDNELKIPDRMSYIVIIVDELADLMQTAPADVESAIARITQKARAAGIHMIIATQTPRADVITGVIKANVPCRMAFQVASALDSRVILDENGAEKLLGQGDMLYRPPGSGRMVRAQGVLVTDEEVNRLVEYAANQGAPAFDHAIHSRIQGEGGEDGEEVSDEDQELVEKCLEVMRQEKKASTSLFQRRLRLGYTRAARILDILEDRGYVGPGEGAKPREILVDLDHI
jgi:S-DNA-T family DNA segregation ATPase FtsK/SpoIIIE